MFFFVGKNPTDEYLDAMMNEAPGPINFTMFLTMFGEKLNGTDPEDVIRNAFACFDEEATGMWDSQLLWGVVFTCCLFGFLISRLTFAPLSMKYSTVMLDGIICHV